MIGPKDIEKLSELSRMKITEEERDSLLKDIDPILEYVSQLNEATERSDSFVLSEHRGIMREDGDPHESGIWTKEILEQAPAREGEMIKVKKIL